VTHTPPTIPQPPLYHEEQRFRQLWLWILVLGAAAASWWPLVVQVIGGKPVGQNPAPDWAVVLIWLFVGIGLPVLFGAVSLVLEVTPERVSVRYRPFSRRVIALTEIAQARARTYNAVKEYGGWGIKGWSKKNVAYNVSGDRGVELTLVDGRRVMLGSRRADELAAVIDAQRRTASSGRPPGIDSAGGRE
jgi:hypothetical protein